MKHLGLLLAMTWMGGWVSVAVAVVGEPSGAGVMIRSDHPAGQTKSDEAVTWTIEQTKPTTRPLHYRLTENNLKQIEAGDLQSSKPQTVTAKLDHAGWLYLVVENDEPAESRLVQSAGVLVAPAAVKPATAPPPDFDSFWKEQIEQIQKIAAEPKVTPGDSGVKGVNYEEITLNNIDGAHVHAQLARPQREGKFPAMVIFEAAGVHLLAKARVASPSQSGWLTMNVMAHDLPLHESDDYYAHLQLGGMPAGNYTRIGNTSPEASYFRKMLLGDYQAIEYLRTRPEWDGKVLLVRGESQGGLQSIIMAALDPNVTAAAVVVPAGADTLGQLAHRMPGWPYWFRQGNGDDALQQKIDRTGRYYDLVNFAPQVKCPTLVAVGLRDTTSPPLGVTAMSNSLGGPHELALMPNGTHRTQHAEGTARLTAWQDALLKTGEPPMSK